MTPDKAFQQYFENLNRMSQTVGDLPQWMTVIFAITMVAQMVIWLPLAWGAAKLLNASAQFVEAKAIVLLNGTSKSASSEPLQPLGKGETDYRYRPKS